MIDGTTLLIIRRTAMTPQDILLHVFCLVDDEMKALGLPRLRRRGPEPALADSEVITIELVGEFWGLDKDRAPFRHFGRYHAAEFPALARVHRTTFVRQAANLWAVKAQLRQELLGQVGFDPQVSILDSFPMPGSQGFGSGQKAPTQRRCYVSRLGDSKFSGKPLANAMCKFFGVEEGQAAPA